MKNLEKLRLPCLAVISIIAWLAVLLQIGLVLRVMLSTGQSPVTGFINTLSYFTVLTNLLVAIIMTASLFLGQTGSLLARPVTMSAMALYIFVVGLTYSLLLRHVWEPTGLQLVADVALHDVIPVLYVLYWLIFVPKGTLRWHQPVYWMIYPTLYFTYAMLRGGYTGKYAYYFIDAGTLGYPKVFAIAVMFVAMFYILGLLVVAIDRWMGRLRPTQALQPTR
jgi:hypothetical protein